MLAIFFVSYLFVYLAGRTPPIFADDRIVSATPYRVKLFILFDPVSSLSETSRTVLAENVLAQCRLQFGLLWDVYVDFPILETADAITTRFSNPPEEWSRFDKIFIAEFVDLEKLSLVEYDVKTTFVGRKGRYQLGSPSKAVDVLIQALDGQFSPLAKLEKASSEAVTLRIQGADLISSITENGSRETRDLAGISLDRSVLLPFIRSMDRNGKLIAVAPISWTVLMPEHFDPITNLLRCRVESSLRYSLGSRRRGATEIYALAVPTAMQPTMLKLQSRMSIKVEENADLSKEKTNSLQTLPVYDVFEAIPGDKKLYPIGHTNTDGTFLLEPLEERPVRTVLIRGGRTLIAQIPIVRGLKDEYVIPIPDDSVRLEAEAAILGIQEEMIDVAARRSILEQRMKKYSEESNQKMVRETEGALNRLKDADRFLLELDQARLRFKSNDPVVQRRIDKMFRDTRRAIRGR